MTDKMDTSEGGAKAMIAAAFPEEQAKIVGGLMEMMDGAVGELKEGLKEAKEDIADLKRQNSKSCGILKGPDLPKRVIGENVVEIFRKTILKKYNIQVSRDDMSACHRLPNNNIIARFIDLKEGSVFDRLVRRFQNWNPNEDIRVDFSMQVTEYDGTIRSILGLLKKNGKIQTYNTSSSGKQRFRIDKNKNWITVTSLEEALNMLEPEEKEKFIAKESEFYLNRSQKRRDRRRRLLEEQVETSTSGRGGRGYAGRGGARHRN